jgi:protoporphyrinogen oxidase
LAAGLTIADQRVDLGSHRLHPAIAPPLLGALRSLLGDDLQLRLRNGRLRLVDRWVAFPFRPADLVRNVPAIFAARAIAHAVRPGPRGGAVSYADVVRERFGASMLDAFYGPYARKIWGVDAEHLSAEVARHRISAGGPADVARRAFAARGAPRRCFYYPRSGFGQITDALADAATAVGARIDLGGRVDALRPGRDGVSITVDGRDEHVGRVLWTAPPGALVAAVADAPATVRVDAATLGTRAMVLVYLVVDGAQYSPFDAHYFADASMVATRVSEPKNYRNGPDPVGRTVLCAEIPCSVDDAIWRDAEQLGPAQVLDGFARARLPAPVVLEAHVHRRTSVYPIHDLATAGARHRVQDWADGLDGVTVLGRQGLAVGDNLHHVMAMGWDAAELAARGWDDEEWRAARARYRRHVVED